MPERVDRPHFLRMAAVFEGGLGLVALALALIFRVDLVAQIHIDGTSIALGLAAAVPPFLLLQVTDYFRFSALERIKRIVLELLGPSLAVCRWYELVFVAALAGLGEELLFRGVLQRVLERWLDFDGAGPIAGLIASNVIFGLLHALTPTYAILAGGVGIYFGLLVDATHPPNLMVPILAHGLYDYLAFLLLRRAAASQAPSLPGPPPATSETASPPQPSQPAAD